MPRCEKRSRLVATTSGPRRSPIAASSAIACCGDAIRPERRPRLLLGKYRRASAVINLTIIGGGVALGAHATKASVRGASTLTTAGFANPILSLLEDVFAFASAIVAILLPALVVVVLMIVALFFIVLYRRLRVRT